MKIPGYTPYTIKPNVCIVVRRHERAQAAKDSELFSTATGEESIDITAGDFDERVYRKTALRHGKYFKLLGEYRRNMETAEEYMFDGAFKKYVPDEMFETEIYTYGELVCGEESILRFETDNEICVRSDGTGYIKSPDPMLPFVAFDKARRVHSSIADNVDFHIKFGLPIDALPTVCTVKQLNWVLDIEHGGYIDMEYMLEKNGIVFSDVKLLISVYGIENL